MLSSYILYILFKISKWNWKNSHISTCSSFCFGSHPNSKYNQIRPKSHHQPNQLPTKPIPSRRWLKEPLLGRPHVIQFQDSEAEPRFFPTRKFFRSHFSDDFFCVEHLKMVLWIFVKMIFLFENCWDIYGCPQPSCLGVSFFKGKAAPQRFGRLV